MSSKNILLIKIIFLKKNKNLEIFFKNNFFTNL